MTRALRSQLDLHLEHATKASELDHQVASGGTAGAPSAAEGAGTPNPMQGGGNTPSGTPTLTPGREGQETPSNIDYSDTNNLDALEEDDSSDDDFNSNGMRKSPKSDEEQPSLMNDHLYF